MKVFVGKNPEQTAMKLRLIEDSKLVCQEAEELADEKFKDPSLSHDILYSDIAVFKAKAGLFEQAEQIMKNIKEGFLREDVLNSLVMTKTGIGLFDEAKKLIKEIRDPEDQCKTWMAVASLEKSSGLDPQKSLKQAGKLIKKIKNWQKKCVAWLEMANTETELGIDARETLKQTEPWEQAKFGDNEFKLAIYLTHIKALSKLRLDSTNYSKKAKSLLEEIYNAHIPYGISFVTKSYIKIAKTEVEANLDPKESLERSKQILTEMADRPNDYEKIDFYIRLARIETKAGLDSKKSLIEAHRITEQLADKDIKAVAYRERAKMEAIAGLDPKESFEKAEAIAEEIGRMGEETSQGLKFVHYAEIATAKAQFGLIEHAKQSVEKMGPLESPDLISFRFKKAEVYVQIAEAEDRAGLDPKESFEKAKQQLSLRGERLDRATGYYAKNVIIAYMEIAEAELEIGIS